MDLISRRAAIDLVRNSPVKEVTPAYMLIDKAEVMTELMMLSPIQSERKKGRWVKLYNGNYKCSVCGDWWRDDCNDVVEGFNYCPNCGAKME